MKKDYKIKGIIDINRKSNSRYFEQYWNCKKLK